MTFTVITIIRVFFNKITAHILKECNINKIIGLIQIIINLFSNINLIKMAEVKIISHKEEDNNNMLICKIIIISAI